MRKLDVSLDVRRAFAEAAREAMIDVDVDPAECARTYSHFFGIGELSERGGSMRIASTN
jgi:hypothetical protein